ncbi:alcohol oxidase [Polyplosphaeria fusca]|uniref:Alcohol oxidase n=1 Tax=Polyplosphaeria fusca TaxID=682080 RepID=A0A9P4QK43_9PLEO|nr:alcohol oxidase [Polyplosphaeria fusca]
MANEQVFDYIIVGGGTAGLVLANRLSEDPNVAVAVVEAGGDSSSDPRVMTPGMYGALLGTELDFGFATVPQERLNGRRIGHTQGKMLGGSSSINLQAIVPFSASDANAWEEIGNHGWNWANMRPYLEKPFSLALPNDETSEHFHLAWAEKDTQVLKGPVKSSWRDSLKSPIGKAWVETFEALGHPLTASPFTGHSTGAYNGPSAVHPETWTRNSSNTAYYQPVASRENLKGITNATVERIVLEKSLADGQPRAVGVQYSDNGETITLRAKKEVVLCAGVFNSPKLLELSGIGDPDVLQRHGIEVLVANKFVGTNLQDHLLCPMSFEAVEDVPTIDDILRGDQNALKNAMELYQTQGTGLFGSSGVTSFAYVPSTDFIANPADGKILLDSISNDKSTHPLDQARQKVLQTLLTKHDEGTTQYMILAMQSSVDGRDTIPDLTKPRDVLDGNYISIISALSHPLSSGSSHIASTNVNDKPIIDHNYMSHPADLEILARHVRYIETIVSTPPFSTLLKPGGRRGNASQFLDGDLEKAKHLVRSGTSSNWHSCGTCAMAPKEKGGVVDEELKVHGVHGLRIVDASIFPLEPQSNLMTLVYAAAERAADIIKGVA